MDDPMIPDDPERGAKVSELTRLALSSAGDQLGPAVLHLIEAAGTIIVHAHRHNGTDAPLWVRHYAHHLIDLVEYYIKEGGPRHG